MKKATWLGVPVLVAAIGWSATGQEDKKVTTEGLVKELGSADGRARTTATAELFRRGRDVLPDLKMAGAKQVSPVGGTVDGTRRIDIIYAVIDGLQPNAAKARAGYSTSSFGLHVEKGTTIQDVEAICKMHNCTIIGAFNVESRPGCYLQIGKDQKLEAVIRQILTTEPKVTTINLNYFES